MKTRIAQLIARLIAYVFGAAAAAMGLDALSASPEAQEIILTIATALVSLGGLVADLLLHKAETGSVLAPPGQPKSPSNAPGGNTTRLRCVAWPLLAFLALALMACASTPTERWYAARASLNAANKVFIVAAPSLDDDQKIAAGQSLGAVSAALARAKVYLPDGGPVFDTALDMVEGALTYVAADVPGVGEAIAALPPPTP